MPDPPEVQEMREMLTTARQEFQRRVDETLRDAQTLATVFAAAIGEVSADIAFEGWRRDIILRMQMGQLGGNTTEDANAVSRS
jgi:hypothetical protein